MDFRALRSIIRNIFETSMDQRASTLVDYLSQERKDGGRPGEIFRESQDTRCQSADLFRNPRR